MGFCATMTGFFLKRECGHICGQKCSRCHKFVCPQHQAQSSRGLICLECEAGDRQRDYDPVNPSYTYNHNDYFLYRNFFYASQSYNPSSPQGSDHYSTFDGFNAIEFDTPGSKYDDSDDEKIDLYAS